MDDRETLQFGLDEEEEEEEDEDVDDIEDDEEEDDIDCLTSNYTTLSYDVGISQGEGQHVQGKGQHIQGKSRLLLHSARDIKVYQPQCGPARARPPTAGGRSEEAGGEGEEEVTRYTEQWGGLGGDDEGEGEGEEGCTPSSMHQRPSQQHLVVVSPMGRLRKGEWGTCPTLRSCLQSRPCIFFLYVIVVLILLASLISLILIAVLVVEPYVRAVSFIDVNCTAVNVSYGREDQTCSCGKGCNSKYRCIRIHVTYRDVTSVEAHVAPARDSERQVTPARDSERHVTPARDSERHVTQSRDYVMYEDETTLNKQCSYYPACRSSRLDNDRAVNSYEREYGRRGHDLACLYNPTHRSEVIQRRRFKAHHVVNGLFWSLLFLLLSSTFIVCAIRRKVGCFRILI